MLNAAPCIGDLVLGEWDGKPRLGIIINIGPLDDDYADMQGITAYKVLWTHEDHEPTDFLEEMIVILRQRFLDFKDFLLSYE